MPRLFSTTLVSRPTKTTLTARAPSRVISPPPSIVVLSEGVSVAVRVMVPAAPKADGATTTTSCGGQGIPERRLCATGRCAIAYGDRRSGEGGPWQCQKGDHQGERPSEPPTPSHSRPPPPGSSRVALTLESGSPERQLRRAVPVPSVWLKTKIRPR